MSNTQIALVTGASGGIGKAIAEALAANGYYVFAAARSMNKLEAMRSSNIEPLRLDVTDGDGVETAVSHIKSAKGRLDLLVNNAGYGIYGTVEGLSQADVRRAFDVNVFGLGQMTQAVLPLMRGATIRHHHQHLLHRRQSLHAIHRLVRRHKACC